MEDPTQEGEPTETINVVPLADLTLVLLIILMVLSPMITQSMIHVATPAVKSEKQITAVEQEEPKKPSEPLLIAITGKGYSLNNVYAESLGHLMDGLRARLAEEPERPVLVTAENQITVGAVVEVLDLAKQNGAERVSLLKRAEDEEAKAS
jgi:biopolymer transport protein ExbD